MNAIDLLTRAFAARHEAPATDDATSRRIVDAATRQFELFGIQRTTMEDVARRADVSRVTVYRRFANKNDLLEAVVHREVRRFLDELARQGERVDSEADRIVEGLVFTITTLRGHTLLQRFLEGEPELFLPQLTTEAGPLLAFARTLIVDYMRTRLPDLSDYEIGVGAEVGIRLALSLILTPESVIDLDDTDGLRQLARHFAAPILDGTLIAATAKKKPRR